MIKHLPGKIVYELIVDYLKLEDDVLIPLIKQKKVFAFTVLLCINCSIMVTGHLLKELIML